jgi:CrcB protein
MEFARAFAPNRWKADDSYLGVFMGAFATSALVFLGSGIGGTTRYWLGTYISGSSWAGTVFPWGTFTINVSGSFLIGLLMGYLLNTQPHPGWRLLLVIGFLGGYTTFSSFSYETANLIRERTYGYALAYVLSSVLLGLAATLIGLMITRAGTRG